MSDLIFTKRKSYEADKFISPPPTPFLQMRTLRLHTPMVSCEEMDGAGLFSR